MTRNHYLAFSKIEIPQVYQNELQQALYEMQYRSGRILVDGGKEYLSIEYLKTLREECVRGYLDGVRDEVFFQEAEIQGLHTSECSQNVETMDYKRMWEKLREQIKLKLEYHMEGEMQSIAESVRGEAECEEILKMMARIEAE